MTKTNISETTKIELKSRIENILDIRKLKTTYELSAAFQKAYQTVIQYVELTHVLDQVETVDNNLRIALPTMYDVFSIAGYEIYEADNTLLLGSATQKFRLPITNETIFQVPFKTIVLPTTTEA